MHTPQFSYQPADTRGPLETYGAEARVIERDGRAGLNFQNIRGRAALPEHTLNEPRGTFTMWVMSLDDLAPAAHHPHHALSNPHFSKYVLLTDRERVGDTDAANFCLVWESYWHPVFYAKFAQGSHLDNAWRKRGAEAMAGHFIFHRLRWYSVSVRWDTPAGIYEMFVNGVRLGSSDTTTPDLPRQACGPVLYFGCPSLVFSEMHFFNVALSPDEIADNFADQCTAPDPQLQEKLHKTFAGRGLPRLEWEADASWQLRTDLSLREKAHYLKFAVQGNATAARVTDEGIRVTTSPLEEFANPSHPVRPGVDMTRMYLWTREVFEGDLHVSLEFKLHAHGGLCLLMAQAAGMQGEDFLADYPLRVDGSMGVVCWQDVRNYHWEFYREMIDVPNHLVSHACLKNPWFKPMSYQIENRRWELNRWYRLDFLQEDGRIRGAVDHVTVMDVTDNAFDNNGPVLLNGRVAIRCMMRTDMTFRNLRIENRPSFTVRD